MSLLEHLRYFTEKLYYLDGYSIPESVIENPKPPGCSLCQHPLTQMGGGTVYCSPDSKRIWERTDGKVVVGYGCGHINHVADMVLHPVKTVKRY